PFRQITEITLKMIDDRWKMEDASLKIYDASGRLIKEFNLQSEICNLQSIKWSGTDQLDHSVPAGVYFVRLETKDFKAVEKIILLR
ncbi:T9SS type A sorting domain-containing protein, partial [candidate division WOR-3 bacterium]|nr:T9SS type A sorting domain-containing protein [candidate division WOR-3 bacterium]